MATITKYKGTSKIKSEGKILIPKEIRDTMGISPGSIVAIEYENGQFIVSPIPPTNEDEEDNQMKMDL